MNDSGELVFGESRPQGRPLPFMWCRLNDMHAFKHVMASPYVPLPLGNIVVVYVCSKQVAQDMVWVWGENGPDAVLESLLTKPALVSALEDKEGIKSGRVVPGVVTQRDLAYSWETFWENVMVRVYACGHGKLYVSPVNSRMTSLDRGSFFVHLTTCSARLETTQIGVGSTRCKSPLLHFCALTRRTLSQFWSSIVQYVCACVHITAALDPLLSFLTRAVAAPTKSAFFPRGPMTPPLLIANARCCRSVA